MQSVHKAIDVLLYVSTTHPVGVTDVAQWLGVPKTSAHRLLRALTHRDLLENTGDGQYRPGLGMLLLSSADFHGHPLLRAADPILRSYASRLGETFFMVVRRGDTLTVAHKAEGSGFLRASPNVGATVPLHATAAGRVYLAFSKELTAEPPLTTYTSSTPSAPTRLRRLVAQTRRDGWSVSCDEWLDGLSATAAPVFAGPHLVAAVAAACSSARFKQIGEPKLCTAVSEVARALSQNLKGIAR